MRAFALAFVVLFAACAPAAPPPAPRAYDVQVDAKAAPFSISVNGYFPGDVEAHAGDTIRFTAIDRGELHTVTFGTLVEQALAAAPQLRAERRTPTYAPRELAAFKLPPILAGSPLFVSQSAAQPCFIGAGTPPPSQACSKDQQRQRDFDGRSAFYNSGYLASGAVFAVRLADTIAPGTYGYLCLLHGVDMSGRIVVRPRETAVPPPEDARARGADELGRIVGGLQGIVDAAGRSPAGTVVGGVHQSDTSSPQATIFIPSVSAVAVGEGVTWSLFGVHTISFNAPQDAVGIILKESDGSWAVNSRAVDPVNSPALSPPTSPITVDSGTWDGKGFRSSGLLVSLTPAFLSYRVTFTQAGTYAYKCLVHSDMEGTIKVGK